MSRARHLAYKKTTFSILYTHFSSVVPTPTSMQCIILFVFFSLSLKISIALHICSIWKIANWCNIHSVHCKLNRAVYNMYSIYLWLWINCSDRYVYAYLRSYLYLHLLLANRYIECSLASICAVFAKTNIVSCDFRNRTSTTKCHEKWCDLLVQFFVNTSHSCDTLFGRCTFFYFCCYCVHLSWMIKYVFNKLGSIWILR